MKRIALISNWGEACGLAEYSLNLFRQLVYCYEVQVMRHCPQDGKFDVVIINYHPSIIGFTADQVRRMKENGSKVILILQESYHRHHVSGPQDAIDAVDAVVSHEEMQFTHYHNKEIKAVVIPHAMPAVNVGEHKLQEVPMFGTCGFAFPAKNMDVTIAAALATGGKALLIAPAHASYNPASLYDKWKRIGGDHLILETGFLSQEEVIDKLSACTATIYFAVEPNGPGQSGTARMMLASRRPAIIRRCPKTKMLFSYEDEIYFVNEASEATQIASSIWQSVKSGKKVKSPSRVVDELNWNSVGLMYLNLIKELCPFEVAA